MHKKNADSVFSEKMVSFICFVFQLAVYLLNSKYYEI